MMDNQYGSGSANPYTPSGNSSPVMPPDPDPQMQMQQDSATPTQGDSLPMQTSDMSTVQAVLFCLECGGEEQIYSTVAALGAISKCAFCGSTNLVYDEDLVVLADATDQWPQCLTFSSGIRACVWPEQVQGNPEDNWHWALKRDGEEIENGWATSSNQAKRICEALAPRYAPPITVAQTQHRAESLQEIIGDPINDYERGYLAACQNVAGISSGMWKFAADENPFAKKDKKKDDDDSKGESDKGRDSDKEDSGGEDDKSVGEAPAAPAGLSTDAPDANLAPGGVQPADAQPAAQGVPGMPGVPAPGEAAPTGQPPQTVSEGDSPPQLPQAAAPTGMDPAAQEPGAEDNAPKTPMDMGQAQIDQAVEALNGIGHDAMEVAYDVDQLFSNWRCNNCQMEGEAQLDENGALSLGGDLFENMAPCVAPAMGGVEDPNPAANVQPQEQPTESPTSQPNIPVKDQQINTNSIRRGFFARRRDRRQIEAMTDRILMSNPGMERQLAWRVASETLDRYPSLRT